jgi:hypothetical protein
MFGWFRKNEKQVPAEKLVAAHELGRRAAESANADIEAYMQARFYPAVSGLVDAVFGDFETPDIPPLVAARIDLKSFLERIDGDLGTRLLPELRKAMAEWLDVFTQAGMSAEFAHLIEHHYEKFKSSVVLAAFQKFLDLADTLKAADDKWRTVNPEKAAEIPFDALGPELGDLLAPYLKG